MLERSWSKTSLAIKVSDEPSAARAVPRTTAITYGFRSLPDGFGLLINDGSPRHVRRQGRCSIIATTSRRNLARFSLQIDRTALSLEPEPVKRRRSARGGPVAAGHYRGALPCPNA